MVRLPPIAAPEESQLDQMIETARRALEDAHSELDSLLIAKRALRETEVVA